MTNGRRLLKNINVLNIVLVLAVLMMANYTVAPLLHINLGDMMPLQRKSAEEKETKPAAANPPSPSDYVIIADENPFHPERKIPPEKKEEKPLPKPEFVVYGTVISDGTSLAYIEDLKAPVNTSGRGKRQIALKTGDVLSGFTLKSVEADKIVMVRGEEKMVIPVRNTSRTKSAVNPAPQQAAAPVGTKSPLSPESLVQKAPLPRTRAPMTPADEKVRQFFQR
jgi:hypothetical protein